VLSEEARRNIMSRIRSRDKKPELAVRSAAHAWDYDFAWAAAACPGGPTSYCEGTLQSSSFTAALLASTHLQARTD
jgi:G:T-mismatch repair DNA endonuclease (very short patch repair protein)